MVGLGCGLIGSVGLGCREIKPLMSLFASVPSCPKALPFVMLYCNWQPLDPYLRQCARLDVITRCRMYCLLIRFIVVMHFVAFTLRALLALARLVLMCFASCYVLS
jgi:hypothetical protein